MTDADKIKWCWNRLGSWDFENDDNPRMTAPNEGQANAGSPIKDTAVEFRIEHETQDGRSVGSVPT